MTNFHLSIYYDIFRILSFSKQRQQPEQQLQKTTDSSGCKLFDQVTKAKGIKLTFHTLHYLAFSGGATLTDPEPEAATRGVL